MILVGTSPLGLLDLLSLPMLDGVHAAAVRACVARDAGRSSQSSGGPRRGWWVDHMEVFSADPHSFLTSEEGVAGKFVSTGQYAALQRLVMV